MEKPSPIIWRLSQPDIDLGVRLGIEHYETAKKKNYRQTGGCKDSTAAAHIGGKHGEIAVARAVGLKDWVPILHRGSKFGDIVIPNWRLNMSLHIEVRARLNGEKRHLVRPDDKDERPNVCAVRDQADEYLFAVWGWLYTHEAKQKKYLRDPQGRGSPAYFPPVEDLRPMSDFIKRLNAFMSA